MTLLAPHIAAFLQQRVKGGAKVDHWGGAKGYQQRER